MNDKLTTAFDRNKDPILGVLKEVINGESLRILEIGSGEAQHAAYFAKHFKNIVWTTSDVEAQHPAIVKTLSQAKLSNLRGPLKFEIGKDDFPRYTYDIVFTANTFHIMNWKQCKNLMKMLGNRMREGSQVIIYGPFNYGGKFTSESNSEFERWLKEKSPERGIRAFEDVNNNMVKNGFTLYKDYEMPANNRLLVYTRLLYVKDL